MPAVFCKVHRAHGTGVSLQGDRFTFTEQQSIFESIFQCMDHIRAGNPQSNSFVLGSRGKKISLGRELKVSNHSLGKRLKNTYPNYIS